MQIKRKAFNATMRNLLFDKFSGKCAYCGCQLKKIHIDHLIPVARGGTDHYDNLMPACPQCNNFKTVFDLETFRRELEMQLERARKTSVNFRNLERYGMIEIVKTKVEFYFEKLKREKETT